ncbi:alcohol dehydrogenase [Bifidobacterium aemilianum]|uniref:Alcohol dehydrogenase n=1 Tax=Bifidobacterium aemilianum TaxID=2493120 RepID=A0A366KAM9_9BIFI|nr:alcohol dehydrogenase [Bifidobacterium aemilianum]RBP98302.1 alcohol dehydrogenase [Bifidobacterium aemilianum]
MNASAPADELPWSHRLTPAVRLLVCLLAGMGVALIGTFAHRMGASRNLPYGWVLALVIVGLSAWCARSRSGVIGLGLHLISSSAALWLLAISGRGGEVLIPIGFGGSAPIPYWSQHVGYFWLFGLVVVQLLVLVLPSRCFNMTPSTQAAATGGEGAEQGERQ